MLIEDSGWYPGRLHDNFRKNEGIRSSLEYIIKNIKITTEFRTTCPFSEKSGHEIIVFIDCNKPKLQHVLITHEYHGEEIDLIYSAITDGKLCSVYERWIDEWIGTEYGNHIWYLNSKKLNWTGFEKKLKEFTVNLL